MLGNNELMVRTMANIKQAEFELNRLAKSISKALRNWKSPGGEPSVPDLAESVRGWKDDLERLSIHDDLNSKSFQTAHRKMAKAWAHRDSREDAIEALDEAVNALEDVPAEMSVPEPMKSYQIRNIRSLYGEEIGRYGYEPNVFGDIYEIHRQLEGFETAPSSRHVDYTNVVRVKSSLQEVTDRYPQGSPLNTLGQRAIKSISMAQAAMNRPAHMRRFFSNAASLVSDMGAQADVYHSPVSYKAQLQHGADDAVEAIEDMQDLMYSQAFYSPQEFVSKAVKAIARVQAAIAPYYDPKATRLANSIRDNLEVAQDNLRDARIKSIGHGAWQHDAVAQPFNEAMNRLGALEAHVRTL